MEKKKGCYSDKPLIQRIILVLAGLTNFVMAYAIYFVIKDDQDKEWQAQFLKRGAQSGLELVIVVAIIEIVQLFIK